MAKAFGALFGFEYKPGGSSDFAGTVAECMKKPDGKGGAKAVCLAGEYGGFAVRLVKN